MPDHAANPDLVADCTALLAVKDALRGTSTLDWNATSTLSTWEGVTLNATSTRVTALVLGDEGLNGSVPLALGDLSALATLDLSDNELTGEIPAELGSLANLQTLRLSGNSFAGCIPPTLEDVPINDLASLNIQYCQAPAPSGVSASLSDGTFSIGTVSATDEDGDTLTYEIAGGDPDGKFAIGNGTGSIPPELGGVADVRRIDLDYNTLTGGIPRELGSLPDLELLYLTDNQLSGSIPPEMGNLRSLKTLYLSYNNLTGALPSELGSLSRLTQLTIEDNSLTGAIPPELGDLSNLRSRHLHLFDHLFDDGLARHLYGLDHLFFHHHGLAGHLDCLRPAGRGEYQQHYHRCGDRQPTN